MSERTIYKCDRCGKESEEKSFLAHVEITLKDRLCYYVLYTKPVGWCKECTGEVLGIDHTERQPKTSDRVEPPSFEDFLREIIREEIEEQ